MAGGRDGRIIDGRFELLERLGGGGMGTVWRARDLALMREVAIKEVRPPDPSQEADGPQAAQVLRERVLREARALGRLSHPNVVTIHHIVDAADSPHPWLVMELLPGGSLQDLIDRGPLPPAEAARIGRDVLAALAAAHAAGIHHRDVKPANILLRPATSRPGDGPSAVLTDFGIAALQGSTALTATGDLVGSPEFIAPERIRTAADLPASDLWSLGMTLYVTVEGVSPLRRATTLATLAAVLEDPVPPPVRSGPLAPVLSALLVRDPAARPDAARLDALLAQAAEDRPGYVPTRPDSPPPPSYGTGPSATSPPYGTDPSPTSPPYGIHGRPTATTARPAAPRSAARRARLAVPAAALAAVLVAIGAYLGVNSSDDGARPQAGTERTAAPTPPAPDASPTQPPPTASRTPQAPPSRPAGSADTPARPAPTTPPAASTPAPPPPGGVANTWVAQLYSEPVSTGPAARDRRLALVRRQVPEARMLRSDDFASLNPGYWVLYAPGPFADGHAAVDWCAERGRTKKNGCLGRYISHRAGDRSAICAPAAGTGGSGRCVRP